MNEASDGSKTSRGHVRIVESFVFCSVFFSICFHLTSDDDQLPSHVSEGAEQTRSSRDQPAPRCTVIQNTSDWSPDPPRAPSLPSLSASRVSENINATSAPLFTQWLQRSFSVGKILLQTFWKCLPKCFLGRRLLGKGRGGVYPCLPCCM